MTNLKNSPSLVSSLKIYIGEMISYKGYSLRISEVSVSGMTVYDPLSGMKATLSLETADEIITARNLAIA